jgi:hypothetical protein
MTPCSCPLGPPHDLDTPEGALEHILAPSSVDGVPADMRDAHREMVARLIRSVGPIPAMAMALAIDDYDMAEKLAEVARAGLLILELDLANLQRAGRRKQAGRWMRETEGR